jgi:hypothetical protein
MQAHAPEYAVFTELSPDTKPMKKVWNTRVFTDTDSKLGDSIRCDFGTGIITLAPGSYHMTGFSMVTYNSGGEPPETATIRAPASAGYCRLRTHNAQMVVDQSSMRSLDNGDPSVICVGSGCTANMTPSLFEAYYTADEETQILLEHQSGSDPAGIYLRVETQNSKWHVLARIGIRRI